MSTDGTPTPEELRARYRFKAEPLKTLSLGDLADLMLAYAAGEMSGGFLRQITGLDCPKCGAPLATNGVVVWCTFVANGRNLGDGRNGIYDSPCDYGIAESVPLAAKVEKRINPNTGAKP